MENSAPPKPKLLDQVRQAIRTRHYSYGTEKAYIGWIKRFIFFHNKRHPVEMGETEIGRFLSSLATESHVSSSTQNQALNALLFLYQEVLQRKIGLIEGVVRAKKPRRLPVVLTKEEVKRILGCLQETPWATQAWLHGESFGLARSSKPLAVAGLLHVACQPKAGGRRTRPSQVGDL